MTQMEEMEFGQFGGENAAKYLSEFCQIGCSVFINYEIHSRECPWYSFYKILAITQREIEP